jgi:hypothetical protein
MEERGTWAVLGEPGPPAVAAAHALALRSAWVDPSGFPAVTVAAAGEGPGTLERAGLTSERARILLQSLTVPGWGQATLGKTRAAWAFFLTEVGVWVAYTSFKVQESMRIQSSEETARLFAGIDVSDRDEEFHRNVGAFPSSDLYNILVVRREAANLYYPSGDLAGYNAYIAAYELTGENSWAWVSEESFERYRDQRQDAQRAAKRANTALAVGVANRLVSALHAARYAHRRSSADRMQKTQWQLLCMPSESDPTELRMGVNARF